MSRQLQEFEATMPDKQALASVLKYLKQQNLKVGCINLVAVISMRMSVGYLYLYNELLVSSSVLI